MIDTEVPGSPGQVRSGADWLRDTLKRSTDRAADKVTSARRTAQADWHGMSGNAYASFDKQLVSLTDDHVSRIGRAAEALDDYAGHLEGVQQKMGGFRTRARGGGLTVSGHQIEAPPSVAALPDLPGDATPSQTAAWKEGKAAYDAGKAKIELYDELAEDVSAEFTRHQDWIDGHLPSDAADAEDDGGTSELILQLEKSWAPFLAGAGLQFWEGSLSKKATRFGDLTQEYQRKADDLRRARRSGNPARRAEGTAPGARERVRDYRRSADEFAQNAKWLRLGGKALGPLGLAVDGYFGYQDIQDGESPSGVVLSSVAGTAAAAGVVVVAGTVGAPVVATAVAAGVVAVGVGWAVSEGWDALPDGFTDTVDDAVSGAAGAVADTAEGAWDEVTSWF